MSTEKISLAIIGGSGLYQMSGLEDTREVYPETPFGRPSAPIVIGTLEGVRVGFLARHGIGHHILPTEVPYRANYLRLEEPGSRTDREHQRLWFAARGLRTG